jgi:hypothetical protein
MIAWIIAFLISKIGLAVKLLLVLLAGRGIVSFFPKMELHKKMYIFMVSAGALIVLDYYLGRWS